MINWKEYVEDSISSEYVGVTIRWNGSNPTLVIPDDLTDKVDEIISYATAVWNILGGEVEFYPELATKVSI